MRHKITLWLRDESHYGNNRDSVSFAAIAADPYKTNSGVNPGQDNTPVRLTKRIGNTTYKVSVHFSRTSKETAADKILRLIQNEAENQVPQKHPAAGKRKP